MQVHDLALTGIREIVPDRHLDERGYFSETYSDRQFERAGLGRTWVQDNQSYSEDAYVLRGLHFQKEPYAQDKLIRVVTGSIFDVAVDIRIGSPNYGRWIGVNLSSIAGNQLLVPKGFAHGFLTLEPKTIVAYKVSVFYEPDAEQCIRFDDPQLNIAWPHDEKTPRLSARDAAAPRLDAIDNNFVYLAQ